MVLSIRAFGANSAGLVCTQEAVIRTKEHLFSSSAPGVFELRFINRSGDFITHTVTVN